MSQNVCRICLNDLKGGIFIGEPIESRPVWTCVADLAGIEIGIDDSLPQEICDSCFTQLQSAMELRSQAVAADHRLRSVDIQPEIKVETLDVKEELYDVGDHEETYIEPVSDDSDEKPLRISRQKAKPEKFSKKKMRTKKIKTQPQCCMCGETFETIALLQAHCGSIHPDGRPDSKNLTVRHKFECPFCKQKFRQKKFLQEHYTTTDFVEPKRDRQKDLQYKQKYYKKLQRKICSICGLQLRDQRSLEVHETSRHSTQRDFICGVDGCKASFGHEIIMRKHKRACHSEKIFICDYCSKSFVYIRQLKQHLYLHISKKPFQCDKCDRSYTLKRVLHAHQLANHSGVDYPFPCEMCDRKYRWKEDLRSHRSAYHFGKFPYVCGKGCGKGYTSSSNRNWHEKRCTLGLSLTQSL